MSVRTETVQLSLHLMIRLSGQPKPEDEIKEYLHKMLAEGLVSKNELEEVIAFYESLPFEDGFGKAILLCRVISQMVHKQIQLENDRKTLKKLRNCEIALKELLQELLVEGIDVDNFIRLYEDCLVRLQKDRAIEENIAAHSRQAFERMETWACEVHRKIKAHYEKLSERVSLLAQSKTQLTQEQTQRIAALQQAIEKAREELQSQEGSFERLAARLKKDKAAFAHLAQDVRAMMENVQKK